MKQRYWKDKNISKRHDLASFKRKVRSKQKKKIRNKRFQGLSQQHKKEQNENRTLNNKFRGYKHIKAPVNFSLIQNVKETLEFIAEIEECFVKRQRVFINLKYVEFIAHGAIVILLAKLVHFKTHNIPFNGNFPRNINVRNTLTNSGFFRYLYEKIDVKDSYSFENEICTHANKKVNSALSDEIIKKASTYIWGEKRRCTGVQRVFLELMHNTNNHASFYKQGDKHWWASLNYIESENKVCFSFIDFGVGIFESLSNKKEGNKFYDIINKMKKLFNFQTNAELLKLLLNGEVHKTITGNYYRGKGLPGIYEASVKNKISNLIIISNDALADPQNNKYIKLDGYLKGTFVYWELNKNNVNIKD